MCTTQSGLHWFRWGTKTAAFALLGFWTAFLPANEAWGRLRVNGTIVIHMAETCVRAASACAYVPDGLLRADGERRSGIVCSHTTGA